LSRQQQESGEGEDERPAAADVGNAVRQALAEGELAFELRIDVARQGLLPHHAVEDFLLQSGQFPLFRLQQGLDVPAAVAIQVLPADEVLGGPVRVIPADLLGDRFP
jgi:hypothetical protein